MSDSKVLISLRRMQWKRAEGEVLAILETYWPEYERKTGKPIPGEYERIKPIIDQFVKDMNDNM